MKKSFTQEEINKKFSSFKTYSNSDMNKDLNNESKLKQMCIDNEPLRDFFDTVSLYIDMLRDIFTGKYKEVPVRNYCCYCWYSFVCFVAYWYYTRPYSYCRISWWRGCNGGLFEFYKVRCWKIQALLG